MITLAMDRPAMDVDRPGAPERPPFPARHDLTDHPLLTLDRLARLAESLPDRYVEHNLGDLPAMLPSGQARRAALRPGEIVRTLADNGCWMVLKHIETDPEYASLLTSCVDEVEVQVAGGQGRPLRCEGFVFLSAPGSVTPAHIDPEHNVLLQLRGTKSMSVGRFNDEQVKARQCEQLHSGGHRNLREPAVDLVEVPLGPGDGLYVPVHAPHLVQNGPAPSVSLSVTWGTRHTLRQGRAHGLNARLRARGLTVHPIGDDRRDTVKAAAQRAMLLVDRVRS